MSYTSESDCGSFDDDGEASDDLGYHSGSEAGHEEGTVPEATWSIIDTNALSAVQVS